MTELRTSDGPLPSRLPDPPPSLGAEHAAALSAHVEAALARQQQELAESIDRAFEHVPRPLRGAVRRVLTG